MHLYVKVNTDESAPSKWHQGSLMALLSKILGDELPTYTVGSGKEHINPDSGLPAFYMTSTTILATPFIWGAWTRVVATSAPKDKESSFTISYDTLSSAPSTFDVQITHDGKTVRRIGPGEYRGTTPKDTMGEIKIRAAAACHPPCCRGGGGGGASSAIFLDVSWFVGDNLCCAFSYAKFCEEAL